MFHGQRISGGLILILTMLQVGAAPLSQKFGFSGPEIFPIDYQVHSLNAADFDGDGKSDLLVINNRRSRLNILYNRTGLPPRKLVKKVEAGVNELPPDARFEPVAVSTELRVVGVAVADFDKDGRPDIAMYGEPKQFQFIRNAGKRQWDDPVTWELEDQVLGSNGIRHGDLNGDGLDDVALLSANEILWFRQLDEGGFAEPMKIPFEGTVQAMDIEDLNADGRKDLLLIKWDHRNPLRVRLQSDDGTLGPEVQHRLPRLRALTVANIDADKQPEVIQILQQSGRVQIGEFEARADSRGFTSSPLWLKPLARAAGSSRGVVWADVNRDGRTDLVHAEPQLGALRVIIQDGEGRFGEGRSFPSLSGIHQIESADWNNNKKPELFVFSPEEKQIGVVEVDGEKRLPFPELLALGGKPLAFAVGRFRSNESPEAAVLVDLDGKRGLEIHRGDGEVRKVELSDEFRSTPSRMFFHDVDQDGVNDLVFLTPYEKIQVLRSDEKSKFEEIDLFPPGGAVSKPIFAVADLDGDGKSELLLPQKNFVRAVVLEKRKGSKSWNFRVSDQINGSTRNSQIGALSFRPGKGNRKASLFMLDSASEKLSVCRLGKDGIWAIEQDVELSVTDFQSIEQIQMAEQKETLGFLGLNSVAWMSAGETGWRIEKSTGFETAVENGRLIDAVPGDLNSDGRTDIVFLEALKNHIEIAVYWAERMESAVRWRVFEQRTFRGVGTRSTDPREAVIGDFTGDKKPDLAILVHDRVLLYPQE
jgi:hypothetical protein